MINHKEQSLVCPVVESKIDQSVLDKLLKGNESVQKIKSTLETTVKIPTTLNKENLLPIKMDDDSG